MARSSEECAYRATEQCFDHGVGGCPGRGVSQHLMLRRRKPPMSHNWARLNRLPGSAFPCAPISALD